MRVKRIRSLVKALTFRLAATVTTMAVFYFFTRRIDLAIGAGLVDSLIKIVVYYFHERIWDKSDFGRIIDV